MELELNVFLDQAIENYYNKEYTQFTKDIIWLDNFRNEYADMFVSHQTTQKILEIYHLSGILLDRTHKTLKFLEQHDKQYFN